ncbi:MAG: hypothetical protein FWF71_02195 [Actinomycetia bacterium]|nr:hypothetical protein [Actinomycetes bacterium]
MPDTTSVVAVKLRYNPKAYWFDPALGEYHVGDHVLVDTERSREVGLVSAVGIQLTKQQLKGLSSPLKPVIRVLDEKDFDHLDGLDAKSREAMPVFRELVSKSQLEIKPVAVEYLFAGDKAVFYFSSDERVDFRDLVRDLANHLHVRVELRQIGVRDEARIFGGLAHCGEELCCARMGSEFEPVSIRMAKEQDLPLNPAKISGACGRLMCCLRYEFEVYKDFKLRAPKRSALIDTPLGEAKVVDHDTPREAVTMRLGDGKTFTVPLKDFESAPCGKDGESGRPCCISRQAMECTANATILLALSALDREAGHFEDATADVNAPSLDTRKPRRGKNTAANKAARASAGKAQTDDGGVGSEKRSGSGRKSRSGQRGQQRGQQQRGQDESLGSVADTRRARRKSSGGQVDADGQAASATGRHLRPGRRSSGLRQGDTAEVARQSGKGSGQRRDKRQTLADPKEHGSGSGRSGGNRQDNKVAASAAGVGSGDQRRSNSSQSRSLDQADGRMPGGVTRRRRRRSSEGSGE